MPKLRLNLSCRCIHVKHAITDEFGRESIDGLPTVHPRAAFALVGHAMNSNVMAQMRERLAVLSPHLLEITDDSAQHAGHSGAASGGHYRLRIIAAAFAGQPRMARHRLVYDALGSLMRREIHALAVIALSPQEFFQGPPP